MGCCMRIAAPHISTAEKDKQKSSDSNSKSKTSAGEKNDIINKESQNSGKSNGKEEKNNKYIVPSTPFPDVSKRRANQHLTQNVVIENEDKDIRDFYEIDNLPVLGSGISGSVKICIHKATNIKYALKTLTKKKLKADKIAKLKTEIQFMADLDHPNILRIQEYFETRDTIFLVLELCRGGELLERLHMQRNHHYSENMACKYVHTMLSAVTYCHSHNIVHRDLKLENFLFENESADSELKLIDFGLSQYFQAEEVLHSSVGTPYYVAPEVLQGNYDAKCDVWSIGVIAYMLLSGTPPFYGKNDAETLQNVKIGRWSFDEHLFKPVSAAAKHFITNCLTKRVSKRPTAKEALNHEWFKRMIRYNESNTNAVNDLSINVVNRLHKFVRSSTLVKICMEVIAHTLQPEQIADLRREFIRIDSTQTGEITYADLRRTLEQHGSFSEEDLSFIFNGVDFDHTGKISYHEFLAATISMREVTEENLRVAFDKMSNHNLYIAAEDIADLLGADASEEDIHMILEENNLKPSSQIYFNEFKQIMNGGNSSPMIHSPYRTHKKKIVFWKDSDSNDSPISRLERRSTNSPMSLLNPKDDMDVTSSTGSAAATTASNTITNTNTSTFMSMNNTLSVSPMNDSVHKKGSLTKDTVPNHKTSNTVTFAVSQCNTPPSIAALPAENELSISNVDISQESSNHAEEDSLLLRHSV
mmetsp:Transcript_23803/g.34084  ORF Transcript_23803/g.34084 Transcript_23803/m.34084 type:complete len:701 (+) Transcript_23803:28-2130(+)